MIQHFLEILFFSSRQFRCGLMILMKKTLKSSFGANILRISYTKPLKSCVQLDIQHTDEKRRITTGEKNLGEKIIIQKQFL